MEGRFSGMDTGSLYIDLKDISDHLADPDPCICCARPINVQRLVKQISGGKFDIKTIDKEGNDLLYRIPSSFMQDKLHSFYKIHYHGTSLGCLRILGDYIYEPAALKDALSTIIDDYLRRHAMNGHIVSIDFYVGNDSHQKHQLRSLPFPADLLGKVLYDA